MKILHRNKQVPAFSMIEMLAIVTIIALLAAFAIPAYLNQIAGTKLSTLWKLAEPAKIYIEGQYLKHNADVTGITVAANSEEMTTPGNDLARCVTIQDGIVSVVADPEEFSNQVIWVAWTPSIVSGQLTWTCTYSAAAATYIADTAPNCTVGTAAYTDDLTCNPP